MVYSHPQYRRHCSRHIESFCFLEARVRLALTFHAYETRASLSMLADLKYYIGTVADPAQQFTERFERKNHNVVFFQPFYHFW